MRFTLVRSFRLPFVRPPATVAGFAVPPILAGAMSVLLGLTACGTARERRALTDEVLPPQPVLAATTKYFGGTLLVQGRLGASPRPARPASGAGRHGWMRGGERSEDDESNDLSYIQARQAMQPRLALTFMFTNTGSQPVEFGLVEVNSLLGNFAPRPAKLALAPGAEGAMEPLLSNLPPGLEELEVTLTLKYGDRSETQVLKLQPAPKPTG